MENILNIFIAFRIKGTGILKIVCTVSMPLAKDLSISIKYLSISIYAHILSMVRNS